MRVVVRTLIAVFLASLGPALAVPAVQAHAQEMKRQSAVGTSAASPHSLTISIDKMSPQFAQATSIVTVSGTLSNHTGSAIPGISVQLLTSPSVFITRADMDAYTAGTTQPFFEAPVATDTLAKPLANGATTRWSVTFHAAAANFSAFGVYPIEVQASSLVMTSPAVGRTFLPYWPAAHTALRPVPMQVSWLWPLIDAPQQSACTNTLTTANLAGEVASGGRLSTLVSAALAESTKDHLTWSAKDHLTWAIDPALVSDVGVMTQPYSYGGSAICTGRSSNHADQAARSWMRSLRTGLAGQSAFITPYADADAAALSHAGMNADLSSAYQIGQRVASTWLPQTFGKSAAGGNGNGSLEAWPVDGQADSGVVTSLATDGGVRAVVLRSGSLPSAANQYDDALGLVRDNNGTKVAALLADSQISSILGSASATSSAAATFAATQDFLAQTAMMAAQAPTLTPARSVVVAPPRRWDPSASEASTLLQLTASAPWLQAVPLSRLASESGNRLAPQRLPAKKVSGAELDGGLLSQAAELNGDLALYKDMLFNPTQQQRDTLDEAAATTRSSAWRGSGLAGGQLALNKMESYITDNVAEVRLIAGKKILLAGTSGDTPVSVHNGLKVPIEVMVEASAPPGSPLSVGRTAVKLRVNAQTTATTRIKLTSSAIETTTLQLQLVTTNGSPLTGTGSAQQMSVQVTRYGRTLLELIYAALGVLVLTSVVRWYRKRPRGGSDDGGTDRVGAGGTG